jgi:hypothetical protein
MRMFSPLNCIAACYIFIMVEAKEVARSSSYSCGRPAQRGRDFGSVQLEILDHVEIKRLV